MPYDWAGTEILQKNTSLPDKRFVIGHTDTLILTDLREWMSAGDREEIRQIVKKLELPTDRKTGTFDLRARIVWKFVCEEIKYVSDPESHMKLDFWQFPAETIALRTGDCEDGAFLIASLLLAAGISPFCIRVVFGSLKTKDELPAEQHAWSVYKDESGLWRILESTHDAVEMPAKWPEADTLSRPGSRPLYRPDICLNHFHVWRVRRIKQRNAAEYLEAYRRRSVARGKNSG